MLRKVLYYFIGKSEREMGGEFDYMRDIVAASPSQFIKFSKIFGIADQRLALPLDLYHIVRIIGAMSEDCGTCVQLEVDLAKKAGLPKEVLKDIVYSAQEHLSAEQVKISEFALGLSTSKMDDPDAREYIHNKYGPKAVVDLAFALNAASFLPSVKRAMGHAISCQKVEFDL